MKDKELLLLTVKISLIIQFITGFITFGGVFIKLKEEDKILRDILLIETIVQLIEGLWYIYIAYAMKKINNNELASIRYLDWVITTPFMLLSTIIFMEYDSMKKENKTTTLNTILLDNKRELTKIGIYNFGMLLFGYLGEKSILNKYASVSVGFIFFGLSFYEIWNKFAYKTSKTIKLYLFLFIVWALYGVAAVLPVIPKNIMYNCLDIISKNFYGLYIYYEIIMIKNSYIKKN
jgi:bacteriorhodopsin|tara:strand:+ start:202 stop:903 length:702 start_codon:yes stop_codon:yes gene_type:complete